jgi:hypothetical protein
MRSILHGLMAALLLSLLSPAPEAAEVTGAAAGKRSRIRHALENEILGPYAIPFHTYANLGMWEELRYILRSNNNLVDRHRLPGLYYSRPYRVADRVWVFENTALGGGAIFVFDPEPLALDRTLDKESVDKYGGSVRETVGATVISGGGDRDVDAAVAWDTAEDTTQTLRLKSGHYIGVIEVAGGRLLIGACGGVVNVWDYPDLTFQGRYVSGSQQNIDWEVFNQKECITAVTSLGGDLAGAGENSVFIWNRLDAPPVRRLPKAMPGSIALFHGRFLVEYRKAAFTVTDLASGELVGTVETDRQIEDLIVTEEPILPDQKGPVIVLTLRHNKGLLFYDFDTLKLRRRLTAGGETVAALFNAVFATDDRHLYRYRTRHWEPDPYQRFIEGIRPRELVLTPDRYEDLIGLLADYPDVLAASQIPERFMTDRGISVAHSFTYGRIAPRPGATDAETRYGYKADFEVINESDHHYLVILTAVWSGRFGGEEDRYAAPTHPEQPLSFFLSPNGGRYSNRFHVGEKEPARMIIYPVRLEAVTAAFRKGLTQALDRENQDTDLIDRYLDDDRVAAWHDELKKRRSEIDSEKEGFWLFRIFR